MRVAWLSHRRLPEIENLEHVNLMDLFGNEFDRVVIEIQTFQGEKRTEKTRNFRQGIPGKI